MTIHEYHDKNGEKIEAGMILLHDSGDLEKVIECSSDEGEDFDLGFDVTNFESPAFNSPNATLSLLKCQPLDQFDLTEWTIKA